MKSDPIFPILGHSWLGLLLLAPMARGDDPAADGKAIYLAKCASCHGQAGEGSKGYQKPLTGHRSVAQLGRYVEQAMPEDDPGTCVGEEARSVSAYLHDAFYSKIAQARNKPPRVELARLTVKQYRNAVADLIGSFRDRGWWGPVRGLRAEYSKSMRVGKKSDLVIERVDPEVRFDFGTGPPVIGSDRFKPYEFAIQWRGSVLAPETGEYEFIVRTENATRLWVNDPNLPLIDASVRSGEDIEHRRSIFLLGGRAYPIRLEFVKAKQGVNDSDEKKAKAPPVKAAISLEWKLPDQAACVIPAHCLSPEGSPLGFAPSTAFPPDDRSVGYERGTSISKEWDQATTDAALEMAAYVGSKLPELSGVDDGAADRPAKLREFGRRFAERAFRRPLTDDQVRAYVDRIFDETADPDRAIRRVVLLVLKSPRFLYREVGGSDAYAVASRVAFALWDAPPDKALLDAAAAGKLVTADQVKEQAWRMMGDPRTRTKLRDFFLQWLKADQPPELSKDPERYPGFDPAVAADLRTSLGLLLDEVLASERADFRQILVADGVYLNGRLARFYGIDLGDDAPFRKVKVETDPRAGVLTHPYLMASLSYTGATSPIHRGVFIARSVLGRGLRPPPVAVAPLAPDLHAGLSTRERVALQTSPASCATCHSMINPLGFGLEQYDAVGRFRRSEGDREVDASGSYEAPSGDLQAYRGARELATILAGSEETHRALVEQLFHHVVKQPIMAYGPDRPALLTRKFAEDGYQLRKLLVDIVVGTALHDLPGPPTP